jgi:hypothetical protein
MELLESLKACRPFLATADDIQSKSGPICYALTDAFVAKYGEGVLHYEHERYGKLQASHKFVSGKLRELSEKVGLGSVRVYFNKGCAAFVLGVEIREVGFSERQTARHRWLDSLIKELEDEGSN